MSPLTPAASPSRTNIRRNGIDISHHQGDIQWPLVVTAGIDFVYCKATEGSTFTDSRFQRHWQTLAGLPIERGAYHFFRPNGDAKLQAAHYLSVVGRGPGADLAPALDVEVSDNCSAREIADAMHTWLDIVEAERDQAVLIYTSPNFWETHMEGNTEFATSPLWLAHYTDQPQPRIPPPWTAYRYWQFAETGTVAGIQGPVDLNRTP